MYRYYSKMCNSTFISFSHVVISSKELYLKNSSLANQIQV